MGRKYAGILGSLAFTVTLIRGVLYQRGAEATLLAAVGSLFTFMVLGGLAGSLAGWIVNDAVRTRTALELEAHQHAVERPGTKL